MLKDFAAFAALIAGIWLVFILVALWPWHIWVAVGALLLIGGAVAVRVRMLMEHHRADIAIKKNQALVPHAQNERGFAYIENGNVRGYTHGALQPPMPVGSRDMGEGGVGMDDAGKPPPRNFSDLVSSGYVGPNKDFLLGFEEATGQPITMPGLTSLGIGGGQGSGKTVTTLDVMMEAVAKYEGHIKFIVSDPHMHVAGDQPLMAKVYPLVPFFLSVEDVRTTVAPDDHDYQILLNRLVSLENPTIGGEGLRDWLLIMDMEMKRRLGGKVGDLWVIVIDEFASVMMDEKTAKPTALMLEAINQQARKMHMFAVLVSQEWLASRTGGTALRDSIKTYIVHNMPEAKAGLIVPNDVAHQAPKMAVGQALIYSGGTSRVGRVPYATEADARSIADRYKPAPRLTEWQSHEGQGYRVAGPRGVNTTLIVRADDFHPVVPTWGELEALQERTVTLPEDFTVAEIKQTKELYLVGLTEADIAKRVYGVKAGPELAEAKIKVGKIMRWLVSRWGG
jgi:hypothetical protein